ncbi:MAG TPA: hypothetical protein PK467_06400 [Candidatus Wallbacteria bacterium]|nr:hypothetical protein [Candidatus Wallbacteria bacterium]
MFINDNDVLNITFDCRDNREKENTWKKNFSKLISKKLSLKELLNFSKPSKRHDDELFCSYSERLVVQKVAVSVEYAGLDAGRREFVFKIISELINYIKKLYYRDAVNLGQVKLFLLNWGETAATEFYRNAASPAVLSKIKESVVSRPGSQSSNIKGFIAELANLKIKTGPNIDLFVHITTTDFYSIDVMALSGTGHEEVIRQILKKSIWIPQKKS